MTERRFLRHADLDPSSVRALPPNHAALLRNQTLFPSTVVEVTRDNPGRILVSGANNRKLGRTIIKGTYAGYALYGLSLEERATCPMTCPVRNVCYGNGMQMARRHRITDLDVFQSRLHVEIKEILAGDVRGVMVRLHVLGDFQSVEYVGIWSDLLAEHPKLATYGYTHHVPSNRDASKVGLAVQSLKIAYPDRFRIRWSTDLRDSDAARVIRYVPATPKINAGVVCPAQLEKDGCCANCAFCWEPATKSANVVFILHGAKSGQAAAEAAIAEIADQQPAQAHKAEVRSSEAGEGPSPEIARWNNRSVRWTSGISVRSRSRRKSNRAK